MIAFIIITLIIFTLIFPLTRDFYISLYYCFKNKKDPFMEFYGMIGFAGYYGQGKSMAMTHTIIKYQKIAEKYGENLKIYTNYHFYGQTGQLNSLNDIERICDEKRKNENDNSYVIFAIDELQNCLNSRNWNETKKLESLLPIFTMTRKLKVMFLYTTPVASMSDKTIRISSKSIYLCKKINRYFFIRWKVEPIQLEGNLKEIKLSLIPTAHTLLNEEIMESYDSFAFIETLQKQDYLTHSEVNETVSINQNLKVVTRKK